MIPQPPEHPRVVLEEMIDQNREGLGRLRACLDWSIQQTCASWIAKHDGKVKLTDLHPNVLAGDFRQSAIIRYYHAYSNVCMRLRGGPNGSIAISGQKSSRTPIRKHPRILSTGFLLPPTPYPSSTLFGEDFAAVPWKPYVIWEADLERQVLREAWLAAIAFMNKVTKTMIFERVPLPPAVLPSVNSDKSSPEKAEDGQWPEWGAEGRGNEPA